MDFITRSWFLPVVLFFSVVFSAAADSPRTHIYFEGIAETMEQRNFFMDNFKMEAEALGYTPEAVKADAGFTFHFEVSRNVVQYDDGTTEAAPPDEPQFTITITLTNNEDDTELVSFGFPYFTLNDMYDYNQLLFVRTVSNIPVDPNDGYSAEDAWRNKWLYVRLSADYPINFYMLQGKGLVDDVAIYMGNWPEEPPTWAMSVDNRIVAQPGISVGFEVQFLSWKNFGLSAEPKFQMGWEYLNNTNFFLMTVGLDLKVPVKLGTHIMLEPYVAGRYNLPVDLDLGLDGFSSASDVFATPPDFGIGGGVQFGIKAGKAGVAFIDINYIYYSFFGDTAIYNNFKFNDVQTNPCVIYYKRSVLGLAIGYKFGFFERKKKRASTPAEE